jgi:hypothetical protein
MAEKEVSSTMKIKALAVLSVVAVLAMAPSAFAFGGGGKKHGGSAGGGSVTGFSGGSSVASVSGAVVTPGPVSAPEPFAGLAVGLGLLGARLLRRRS